MNAYIRVQLLECTQAICSLATRLLAFSTFSRHGRKKKAMKRADLEEQNASPFWTVVVMKRK